MHGSTDRIITTHVGALPGPHELWEAGTVDPARLQAAVDEVVRRQREAGVDLVNEGELTKGGNWVQYVNARLSGFEARPFNASAQLMFQSTDWQRFDQFYRDALAGGTLFEQTRAAPSQERRFDYVCTGEIRYVGQAPLARQIDCLRAAVGPQGVANAFLTSTAPNSIEVGRGNEHYATQEAFMEALAEALREEYEAIVAAGFQLQVDDAWLPALWDRIGIPMGIEAFRRYCRLRIEALNHALRNVPDERVRYHMCWGSWHGPHSADIEMRELVDLMLEVKAQTYLFEAANARHEHEFQIWETVKLPGHKLLAPGVVTHSTPLVEHRELVALRIERFAQLVGKERVIASTDCGLGLRCHPQIAWAKLESLSQGAQLATRRLWGR